MNSYVRNAISNDLFADFEQEKAPDTTEALLESCSTADSSHKVFRQYGCSTTPLYTVNEPLIIGHQLVEGWLALPMRNCAGELTSLSFISPSKADKSIYFTNDNLKGCVILGKPLKDKPLFVVCDPEAAFAISRSGLPCLLTQSPYVRNGKNRAVGGDCADMGNIINEWSNSGYTQIYAPVGCDLASTYKLLLKECKVHVLGLALPIDQYIESSVLKSELLKLIDAKKVSEWAEPSPISPELSPVTTFTQGLLPYELDQYVNDQASRVPMPPDFIAVTVLTALSAVLGARVAIKPKQLDDFSIVPNLWGGFIAPPSSKKSGALKSGITPLDRLVAQARQAHAEELKAFQAQEIMSKANETVLKKQVGETVQKDGLNSEKGRVLAAQLVEQQVSDSNKPVLMRYSTNDSSPEALSELEITRPNGILVVRDELVGLLATLDKEGNESARTYYLEGWNGDSSYQVDRIMRGDKFIQNHCLSVMGGIQPDKLIKYLEPCINGLGNDGLIQRFQLLVYPDPIPWDYRDHPLNKDARDSVFTLFKKIENLTDIDLVKMGALPADDNNKRPYFRFSDQAQAFYIQWVTQLEKEKIANEEHSIIIEHLSKYNKLMPALALIFHVIDCIDMPTLGGVSLKSAEMAGAWCDYLETHARRIYGLVLDNRRSAATLSKKLKYVSKSSQDNTHNWMTDGFTARQVRQKNWKGLTDQKTIQDAIEILIDENWLSFEETFPSAAGGRPSITYFINPKILE